MRLLGERERKESREGSRSPTVDGKPRDNIITNKGLHRLDALGKGGGAEDGAAVGNALGSLSPNEEAIVLAEREEDGDEFSECSVGDHSIGRCVYVAGRKEGEVSLVEGRNEERERSLAIEGVCGIERVTGVVESA